MNNPSRRRTHFLWLGVALAALAGLSFALNLTAVPVVMDVPLVTLAIASLATAALLCAIVRERGGTTGDGRARFGLREAALLVVLIIAGLSVREKFLFYQSDEVHFTNGDVQLAGTFYSPRSRGPHPAVVFIHGSGPETRKEYAYFAKLFARNNFAALAYDKRGVGQSSGKLYESDYRAYAKDALAAVDYLKRSDGVDPGCIGLIGFSEGEWVAPLAATLSNDIAFLIVVGPSGVSPAKQVNEEIALRLRARGYSADDVDRALALNERVFEYQRTGREPEGLAQELRKASTEQWFRDAHDIPAKLYPADDYPWWRSVMDFEPGPVWQQVKQPVLILKGGEDPNSTADRARREIERALKDGGSQEFEFVVFPSGDHAILRWPLGKGVPPPLFASGYLQTMVRWAKEQRCARR